MRKEQRSVQMTHLEHERDMHALMQKFDALAP